MPKSKIKHMEFHISRAARDRYQLDQSLFELNGNVIFTNFHAARQLAQSMNQKRNLISYPERVIRAGQINAMGLIDEILHLVIFEYQQQINPEAMKSAVDHLLAEISPEQFDKTLLRFIQTFPPLSVYNHESTANDYLKGETEGISNRQLLLEELLMLWLANKNPAFSPHNELFDDSELRQNTPYLRIIDKLHDFFDNQPFFGPDHQNIIDMLGSPAVAVPHSLSGQLDYIRTRWGYLLGKYLYRLLSSLDLIKEEEKAIYLGPGPSRIYDFGGLDLEAERFSADKEWMPNLVMIAKNAFVWLDQLSKKYQRAITRLDQIPDEELDTLARWGFSGLWLIGLWERSQASQRIKQLRGNPDAVASAYSLFTYNIAYDLGGEEAYLNLRDRAWQKGIRLASDMVPNHMGIDSNWVIDHPEWFIHQDYSPFPSYMFNGPNLSTNEHIGLYIEDHYYDNTDAAVVFMRVDHGSGDVKFIYHGNDGTSMPWNDTAQLNYLLPEVREAVIQTILAVARKFPIIRFDAAMTLAKKHYQRLWFPEPGSGGDIPSRAEHAMTKEQFDAAFPVEFWRDVVDRVAAEVPDTLLLAEAFWLMEGYFVRTLGMHRVYNSAFMNMLRDEKNQEYRLVIKNTLEFEPQILKRYVNFMNNPDELTAIEQFGNGDKYFGICVLMATLPGLPMFGHGQIEGYTEKYGMEYRRAYWDEKPDNYLIDRHEREIFPLLKRRYIFAESEDFRLYDFFTPEGTVNEDVYAYSNRAGDQNALVIYHNKYAHSHGWIRMSTGYPVHSSNSDQKELRQFSLAEALALSPSVDHYTIFRDEISGFEYIRSNAQLYEQGLWLDLAAYQYHVFMDIREVQDNQWNHYAQLAAYLGGRGVPDINEVSRQIILEPVLNPYRELINVGQLRWFIDRRLLNDDSMGEADAVLNEIQDKIQNLLNAINRYFGYTSDIDGIVSEILAELDALLFTPQYGNRILSQVNEELHDAVSYFISKDLIPESGENKDFANPWREGDPQLWSMLFTLIITRKLGKCMSASDNPKISRAWIDEWLLGKHILQTFKDMGINQEPSERDLTLIKILVTHQHVWEGEGSGNINTYQLVHTMLEDHEVQQYLGVNRYQDIIWFNKEAFENLIWNLYTTSIIQITASSKYIRVASKEEHDVKMILKHYSIAQKILGAGKQSHYQVEGLIAALN